MSTGAEFTGLGGMGCLGLGVFGVLGALGFAGQGSGVSLFWGALGWEACHGRYQELGDDTPKAARKYKFCPSLQDTEPLKLEVTTDLIFLERE